MFLPDTVELFLRIRLPGQTDRGPLERVWYDRRLIEGYERRLVLRFRVQEAGGGLHQMGTTAYLCTAAGMELGQWVETYNHGCLAADTEFALSVMHTPEAIELGNKQEEIRKIVSEVRQTLGYMPAQSMALMLTQKLGYPVIPCSSSAGLVEFMPVPCVFRR